MSDTVVVKIGAGEKKYTLHKRLLEYHSEYFRGVRRGRFRETEDGVIGLDDIDTDTFDIFVDWMYEKKLPLEINAVALGDGQPRMELRACVLADRLLAIEFKRTLMGFIFNVLQKWNKRPSLTSVLYSFANLPEKDPMLQLLIDAWSVNNGLGKLRDEDKVLVPQLPKDFLTDVIIKLHQLSKVPMEDQTLQYNDYIVPVEGREGR